MTHNTRLTNERTTTHGLRGEENNRKSISRSEQLVNDKTYTHRI